tara:strand:- start:14246 stop:14497 length:252 start_codon:yes stop_codon:yes gene_type:complete
MKTKCIGCDGIPAANRFVVGANVKEEIRFNITILIQNYSLCARCFDDVIGQIHLRPNTQILDGVSEVYVDEKIYDMPNLDGDV